MFRSVRTYIIVGPILAALCVSWAAFSQAAREQETVPEERHQISAGDVLQIGIWKEPDTLLSI